MLIDTSLIKSTRSHSLVGDVNPTFAAYTHVANGTPDIGANVGGTNTKRWSLEYNLSLSLFMLSSEDEVSYSLGGHPPTREVTQVNMVFDNTKNVIWAYSYIDTVNGVSHILVNRYDKDTNLTLIELEGVTSPTLTLDASQNKGGTDYGASILLSYISVPDGRLCVRQSDDGFGVERTVQTLVPGEFLIKSGMTTDRRFNVTSRKQTGYVTYKALLTHNGGLLLNASGNPFWVGHQRT